MTFGSLFAGIGGIDRGLELAGMECQWQVEIDPFCTKVLAKHWPDVRRYEDVRKVGRANLASVDLIAGGFPCQDISPAGRNRHVKKGTSGNKSGLWFEYARVIEELRPTWAVIENTPQLLKTNGGNDFRSIIRFLGKCGYVGWWRVLDAQYFGVATKRRRLFVVAYSGTERFRFLLSESNQELLALPPKQAGRNNLPRICGWGGGLSLERLGQCVLTKTDSDRNGTGYGISRRMDGRRWNALGNAVVPQCAEWIGRRIMDAQS